jgi:uncharacterized protein YggE
MQPLGLQVCDDGFMDEGSGEQHHGQAEPTVTVLGQAAVRAEPDQGFVWITLRALDNAPGPALADVAARSTALEALLDELEVPSADRSTTGITVREEFEHTNDGMRSLGHRAAASLSVRVNDTDLIGRVIMRATDELDARIAGPSWQVSIEHPARLAAAENAATNARAKAEAFAAGLGVSLGRLVTLKEPDEVHHYRGISIAAAHGGSEIPVETGEQDVVATIQATFTLEAS